MDSIKSIFKNSLKEHKNLPNVVMILTKELMQNGVKSDDVFMEFYNILKEENKLEKSNYEALINGIVNAKVYEKEQILYKSLYEKEQLELSIQAQKDEIYSNISQILDELEEKLISENITQKELSESIKNSKFQNLNITNILKETTEFALLSTIENSYDIEDTAEEISKNIVFQAINEGAFLKQRFFDIAINVVDVAVGIADGENIVLAKELLSGVIKGSKEGILKSVEKFKNDLKFLPKEVEKLHGIELKIAKKELFNIEEHYILAISECAKKTDGISAKLIPEILKEIPDNYFNKMRKITQEASESLSERLDLIKTNASLFEQEIKEKAYKKLEMLKEDMKELEKKANEAIKSIKLSTKQEKEKELKEKAYKRLESFKEDMKELEKKANEAILNLKDASLKQKQDAKKLGFETWERAKDFIKSAKDSIKKND